MTAWLAGGIDTVSTTGATGATDVDTPWLAGLRLVRVQCRLVASAADLARHLEIRRAVFVDEQQIFDGSDRDPRDDDPATLHVLGLVDGVPAGTVRLFPLDAPPRREHGEPDWQGDRLAVLPPYRTVGLGAPLVRFAVSTGGARGGRRMLAHVQPCNRTFFRRLGWTQRGGTEIYVGVPHLRMEIALSPAERV